MSANTLVILDLLLVALKLVEDLANLGRRARAGEEITDAEMIAAQARTQDAMSRWIQAAPHDRPD